MTKEEFVELLTIMLNKKYGCLQKFLKETQNQKKFIEEEKFDKLNDSLGRRESLIHKIGEIEEEIRIFITRNNQEIIHKDTKNDESKNLEREENLKRSYENINQILLQIKDVEEENTKKVEAVFNDAKSQVKSVNKEKNIVNAYLKKTIDEPPSYFIDKKR